MFIQNTLSSLINFFPDLEKSADSLSDTELEIPTETLSRAVLDKQSDGSLRWKAFGFPKHRIFESEESLDCALSQNELVDIWEIEDKRAGQSQTIYKCCDPDDNLTFKSKEELYRELALTTADGVFRIHNLDTHEELCIQQKKGWFQHDFDEVLLEKARKTLRLREETRMLWRKS